MCKNEGKASRPLDRRSPRDRLFVAHEESDRSAAECDVLPAASNDRIGDLNKESILTLATSSGTDPDRSAPTIRLTIATQPALWGELLERVLEHETNIQVQGLANNEETLAHILRNALPGIVLLDYEAMGAGCEGVIARLRRTSPQTRFLVLARRTDEAVVVALLRAGAAGLVDKQGSLATVLAAIRAVAAGETWAHRRITAQALTELSSWGPARTGSDPELTRREWQVAEGVSRGLRNRDIALTLGIREKTVKAHLSSIFSKLGVRSRMELALWVQGRIQPGT